MKLFAFLAIFSILYLSSTAAWHGRYRTLAPDQRHECKVRLDPHVDSFDKAYLGTETCDYLADHPYPCYESEGLSIQCIFAKIDPSNPANTYTIIKSIRILFVNGRYREGFTADPNFKDQFESGVSSRINDYTGENWLEIIDYIPNKALTIVDHKSRASILITGDSSMVNLYVNADGWLHNTATGMCVEGCPHGYSNQGGATFGRRKREIKEHPECQEIKGKDEKDTINLQRICNVDITSNPKIVDTIREQEELNDRFLEIDREIFNAKNRN